MGNFKLTVLLLFVLSLFVGCSTYTKHNMKHYEYIKEGVYGNTRAPLVKDFESKGLIFVESKVTIDVNGERTGSEITNEMLMRAADKVGADDVINVKIDEIEDHKVADKYDEMGNFVGREYIQKNYIYKASALAIKYTNVIETNLPVPMLVNNEGKNKEEELIKLPKIYKYSKIDIIGKIGAGVYGESELQDYGGDEKNIGQVSCEVDGLYWFDKIGLGAGISLDMLNSYKINEYYYSDYYGVYQGYYCEKEKQLFFNIYAILAARVKNYYIYANLGTKLGAGVGVDISNFLIDLSYNKFNERDLDHGFKLKSDKVTLSLGYKFAMK